MPDVVGLDFETACDVNLPVHGADRYFNDPSFRVLVAALHTLTKTRTYDFVHEPNSREDFLRELQQYTTIVGHNVAFEMQVLQHLGVTLSDFQFIDSAVITRAVGAGSKLEAAAPQLLGIDKMEEGSGLIKKFSIPREDGSYLVDEHPTWDGDVLDDWHTFVAYCALDAKLTWEIYAKYNYLVQAGEIYYFGLTYQMNQRGWFVNVENVKRMQEQYEKNLVLVESEFRTSLNEPDLNFRSTPQLRKWCAERGINARSFDELNVSKLLTRITKRIEQLEAKGTAEDKLTPLREVVHMLTTKQTLGGSSLSKLQKILDMVGADGRLREQYLHVGAGQTYRTSGRGVQLQNLKRLGAEVDDLDGDLSDWDNERLARNLRQVFEAQHPDGLLFVGDFSAVESRGLAYLAGAEWKLDAYRQGKDMYKVLASGMLGVPYEYIDKSQRQLGKVGELSCGYGAGPGAVKDFAEKMGTILSDDEAKLLVLDWRDANPEIVQFWNKLNDILQQVIQDKHEHASFVSNELRFSVRQGVTPMSIREQRPDATTIVVEIRREASRALLVQRTFQGAYMHGNDMCYLKPSELKSGKLWLEEWTKDRQRGRYKIYGGKLAGILTQSFCRELFFDTMSSLDTALKDLPNAFIVGQFHDEIVVEWSPLHQGDCSDGTVLRIMESSMSTSNIVRDFPLASEINFSHKYIK